MSRKKVPATPVNIRAALGLIPPPTQAEVASVRHTRAQLAAWGVPWPPKAGWRRNLRIRRKRFEAIMARDGNAEVRARAAEHWVTAEEWSPEMSAAVEDMMARPRTSALLARLGAVPVKPPGQ